MVKPHKNRKQSCEVLKHKSMRSEETPYTSADYASNLLALKDWQGQNVFLVRRRVGQQWIQVIEGGGKISIELRRCDGGQLDKSGKDKEEIVRSFAREWLADELQPAEFHAVTEDAPRIATWLTVSKEKLMKMGCLYPSAMLSLMEITCVMNLLSTHQNTNELR